MNLFGIDFREPKELATVNTILNLFSSIWDISTDWAKFWDEQRVV